MAYCSHLLLPMLITTLIAQQTLQMPPPTPTRFPPNNEAIPAIFLADPLVQNALTYVQSVVPPAILAISTSIPVDKFSLVKYTSNATENCYWPADLCLVKVDTRDFKADITSCLGNGDWGMTYDGIFFKKLICGKDGPIVDPAAKSGTKELLSSLKQTNFTSTFFVIGGRASAHPELLTQAANEGHEIAVHTWSHHPLTTLTNEQIVAEFKYTGKIPRLFRPPYGDCDNRVRAIASALGYRTVFWEDAYDSKDADLLPSSSTAQVTANAQKILSWFNSATNKFITLQHDTSVQSVASALQVLEGVRDLGTGFVMKGKSVAGCNNVEWFLGASLLGNGTATTTATSVVSTATGLDSKGNDGKRLFVGAVGLLSVILFAL